MQSLDVTCEEFRFAPFANELAVRQQQNEGLALFLVNVFVYSAFFGSLTE